MSRGAAAVCALALAWAAPAAAQAQAGGLGIRGFAEAGLRSFQASESMEALFGAASAPTVGGGVDVLLPRNVFASLRLSRLRQSGQRVFVFGGQTFPLAIEDTLTVSPLQIGGGLRFARPGARLVPYAGGGLGWYRVTEEAAFSDESEIARQTTTGYYVSGGVEARLWRFVGAAGEVEWSAVPDAFGRGTASAAAAFGETNLGSFSVRVKVLVGSW